MCRLCSMSDCVPGLWIALCNLLVNWKILRRKSRAIHFPASRFCGVFHSFYVVLWSFSFFFLEISPAHPDRKTYREWSQSKQCFVSQSALISPKRPAVPYSPDPVEPPPLSSTHTGLQPPGLSLASPMLRLLAVLSMPIGRAQCKHTCKFLFYVLVCGLPGRWGLCQSGFLVARPPRMGDDALALLRCTCIKLSPPIMRRDWDALLGGRASGAQRVIEVPKQSFHIVYRIKNTFHINLAKSPFLCAV